MVSRGIIIGKIVDDFASLAFQLQTRNKLGQFDLTKICEDFIKEVLNIVFSYNLKNLNNTRSNNPGLDLGDFDKRISFQVTSQKTSKKINNTLVAIDKEQKANFDRFCIFILGAKQSSYSINNKISRKINFNEEKDIWDIDSLLKEIVTLDIDKLEMLYNLFIREFRQVKIELEPIDENGNFESSYYNIIEKKPASPPKNGLKFLAKADKFYEKEMQTLLDIYERLASVPRVTREILSIIVDKGKYDGYSHTILPEALERFMRIDQKELLTEINLLENYYLVHITEDSIGERDIQLLVISDEYLNLIFCWLVEKKLSIRTLLNTMDFTILDK